MCWLAHITSSLCSRRVNYCMQSSSTQHPSSFPSNMVSKPTQSRDPTLHAFKSALTQPPLSQPWLHLTLGCFHKTATSFTTRDCSMSPMIRMLDWTSCTFTTTIVWQDTPASPRPSRIYIASSTGRKWSHSSPTTSTRVQSAVAASPSITSPLALIGSSRSAIGPGTRSRWTSSRVCPCQMGMIQSWW